MGINFFDLVDGLIHGVIRFILNLGSTTALLIRAPYRASAVLMLRSKSRKTRQISGSTFLFTGFFLLFVVLSLLGHGKHWKWQQTLGEFVATPISLSSSAMWSAVLAALVTTGVIELFYGWLALAASRKRSRRAIAVSAAEYTALVPSYVLGIAMLLGLLAPQNSLSVGIALAVALAGILLTAAPARIFISRIDGTSFYSKSNILHELMIYSLTLASLCIAIIMGLSIIIIDFSTYSPFGQRTVRVTSFHCDIRSRPPFADLLLLNESRVHVLVRPESLRVAIVDRRDNIKVELRSKDSRAETLSFSPGEEKLVRIDLRADLAYRLERDDGCRVYHYIPVLEGTRS